MKKVFLTLTVLSILVACGSNEAGKTPAETAPTADAPAATTEPEAVDISQHPDYKAGLALEAKSDCAACHKVDDKLVGPSFREIANKYTNDDSTVSMLADKIISGGSGNWGPAVMTPHPTLSKEDATAMVKYILLLKK
ncbi:MULTISPECIES: c-type cytochrome [Chitinophagaceae]|uniref:c-type cytochrome n=1 Tax=Chitinophagaceae TaxID=563835 RepID=UPI000DEEC9B2|nr:MULTISPECIES: c-type cytochrome [Chitinophagaceae]RPD51708.1 cytochrome c class I [Paracnuella aquatica]